MYFKDMKAKNITTRSDFTASGVVIGKLWGGGSGAYPSATLRSESLKDLRNDIQSALDSGALDSGFGFERLTGAEMYITETISKEIDGEIYTRNETTSEIFGEISDSELNFLSQCEFF
jgi:hypothetical protein